MTEFLRDPDTGLLYAYKDGELVGQIIAMGEESKPEPSTDLWELKYGKVSEEADR